MMTVKISESCPLGFDASIFVSWSHGFWFRNWFETAPANFCLGFPLGVVVVVGCDRVSGALRGAAA